MWGSWGMPMWGVGWLIPLIGFAFCLAFVVVMMRAMSGGRFEELAAGNTEFVQAEKALGATIERIDRPEVRFFMETFVASFRLTLDELK